MKNKITATVTLLLGIILLGVGGSFLGFGGRTKARITSDAEAYAYRYEDGFDPGDKVVFGNNEKCNTWTVLERRSGKALLYSDDMVGSMSFFRAQNDTYDRSFPALWMNNEYKNNNFSEKEINAMDGQFFLLDEVEIKNYFPDKKDRQIPSDVCYWLMNSKALKANNLKVVDSDGNIIEANNKPFGVRPAVWVNIEEMTSFIK